MYPPPIIIPKTKEVIEYKKNVYKYRKKYEINDCLEWGYLFYHMKGFVRCQHFLDYIEELCKQSLQILNDFITFRDFNATSFKNLKNSLDKQRFEIDLTAKYGEYVNTSTFTKNEQQTIQRIELVKLAIENRMQMVKYYYKLNPYKFLCR